MATPPSTPEGNSLARELAALATQERERARRKIAEARTTLLGVSDQLTTRSTRLRDNLGATLHGDITSLESALRSLREADAACEREREHHRLALRLGYEPTPGTPDTSEAPTPSTGATRGAGRYDLPTALLSTRHALAVVGAQGKHATHLRLVKVEVHVHVSAEGVVAVQVYKPSAATPMPERLYTKRYVSRAEAVAEDMYIAAYAEECVWLPYFANEEEEEQG